MPSPMSIGSTAMVTMDMGTPAYPIMPNVHSAPTPTINSESSRKRTLNIKNRITSITPTASPKSQPKSFPMLLDIASITLLRSITVALIPSIGLSAKNCSMPFTACSFSASFILPCGVTMIRLFVSLSGCGPRTLRYMSSVATMVLRAPIAARCDGSERSSVPSSSTLIASPPNCSSYFALSLKICASGETMVSMPLSVLSINTPGIAAMDNTTAAMTNHHGPFSTSFASFSANPLIVNYPLSIYI